MDGLLTGIFESLAKPLRGGISHFGTGNTAGMVGDSYDALGTIIWIRILLDTAAAKYRTLNSGSYCHHHYHRSD